MRLALGFILLAHACARSPGRTPIALGASPPAVAEGETVRTEAGLVAGQRLGTTQVWKGIPYAAPPVGPLRWRPPQPPISWPGVRAATGFGYACMQGGTSHDPDGTPLGSEDCLTLNVWAPARSGPLPVMVFVHGGYFTWGASSYRRAGVDLYDGRELAERASVVVVTVNYRLGPLGFLAHPAFSAEDEHGSSGDYGLLDQMAALGWVKRNIARFGGDPARITLLGQSAGAISTGALVASPQARGLFGRALLHSGNARAIPQARAMAGGDQLTRVLGCDRAGPAAAVAFCLRSRSASAIVAALPESFSGGYMYAPVVDGWVLPDQPLALIARGAHNRVPLVIGTPRDEFTTMAGAYLARPLASEQEYREALAARFGSRGAELLAAHYPSAAFPTPQDAYVAALGDVAFVCPSDELAQAAAGAQREPVWRFEYAHGWDAGPLVPLRAGHAMDLYLVFRNWPRAYLSPTPREAALSDTIIGYWSRFARSGDPNGAGAPAWPRWQTFAPAHLVLDLLPGSRGGLTSPRCAWPRAGATGGGVDSRPPGSIE
jgi:para-nitrobenzyl esterase